MAIVSSLSSSVASTVAASRVSARTPQAPLAAVISTSRPLDSRNRVRRCFDAIIVRSGPLRARP